MSDELVKVEPPNPPAEITISIIKGALGAVPWVGQALIEVFFDGRSRIKQERINRLLLELTEDVRREAEFKVDFEYLRSEEFSDFLEELMLKAAKNKSEGKRKIYKDLLLSSIKGRRIIEHYAAFMDILSEMTEQEIVLFGRFYRDYTENPSVIESADQGRRYTKDDMKELGHDYLDFLAMVQSMIRKGLLHDVSMGRYDADPYEFVRITELGRRFYQYVTCQ